MAYCTDIGRMFQGVVLISISNLSYQRSWVNSVLDGLHDSVMGGHLGELRKL